MGRRHYVFGLSICLCVCIYVCVHASVNAWAEAFPSSLPLTSRCFVFHIQEVKKVSLLRTQLDVYKRQVQDLQLKSTEETKRADKAEFEAQRHQEKSAILTVDKEVTAV